MHPYKYSNEYFGISIDLPADWKITTHKRLPISPHSRDVYQLYDDDVPTRPGVAKMLFSASKERSPYVDAKIEISCSVADQDDVFASVLARKKSIRAKQAESSEATKYWHVAISELETGEWELDGLRFQYIDEVSGGRSRVIHRFAFVHIPAKGWIELHAMGCEREKFEEVLTFAETLRCSGGHESDGS